MTAPRGLRAEFTRRIVEATKNAAEGQTASLTFKVNALTDRQLADSPTEAAAAGIHVDLLVHSTCVLRPDEHRRIRVRSIVADMLQHSRLFAFRTGDEEEIFLGSADLMPRNLDGRVEVLVRIDQEHWRRQLRVELDQYWGLRTDAWDLSPDAGGLGTDVHRHGASPEDRLPSFGGSQTARLRRHLPVQQPTRR